ncbi:MAG: ABC transporter ATP-binding protein [Bdellovibrionia bacterium]
MLEGTSKRLSKYFSKFLNDSSFIRHYLWKYRRWVLIGLFALIVVDLLDILPPIFLKYAVDIAVEKQPTRLLAIIALAYFGVSLLQGVCRYVWRMYLIRASIFAGRDLRGKYAHHIFGLSVSFFDHRRMGDLMSLAINDVEAVRIAVGSGLLVFADAMFYLLTVPFAMYWLSPWLTLLVCLPLPIIPLMVLKNEKEVNKRFEEVQACFGRISAMTQESLHGVRVTKSFAREDVQIQRMREIGEEYMKLNLGLARIQTAIGPFMDFCMSIGMVLLLFVGGRSIIIGSVSSQGVAIGLGTFVAFQRYIQKMVWPMAALGMAVNYYQRSVSSSYRLKEIFKLTSDVPNAANPILPKECKGHVEFRNLSFRFPSDPKIVLKDINLTIEPGERIAIVGTIGAGKSAMLSLFPRLYPIDRDMLFIDGVDVNDWPIEDLRRQIGYVSQEIFLFSDTVMGNVGFGLNDWIEGNDPGVPIEEAARVAALHEEITGLSSAYRTRLGERGISLSGGQKQRLTIARALAKKPSILVLDDALSSVDVQTEEKILKGLLARPGRNTEVIAAHRISTVKDADKIVVLNQGRIVQLGTHQELAAQRSGAYWQFFEQQQLKEDLESYENEIQQ